MPTAVPQKFRFNCNGVVLTKPIDAMADGDFPVCTNIRVTQEGRIEGRPGYQEVSTQVYDPASLHSIRRLNDVDTVYNSDGYTYFVGVADALNQGAVEATLEIADGFSGLPLSFIPFRPENSPASWMYVFDRDKQIKVRSDGAIKQIGVPPPKTAPTLEYGVPAMATLNNGETGDDWVVDGVVSTAKTEVDRTNGSTPSINGIIYDNGGTTGWCCLNPVLAQSYWAGERMRVILDRFGPKEERVAVREIHPAIEDTTIESIVYDNGTDGLCTIVLTDSPVNLVRNSMIRITSEFVRVLSVTYALDGTAYSIRCSTVGTCAIGNLVYGHVCWRVWTEQDHLAGESIGVTNVLITQSVKGTGNASTLYVRSGTVDTLGTAVTWVSGDKFSFSWQPGTVITINNVEYIIDGVTGDEDIVLTATAGTQSGVNYSVSFLAADQADGRPVSEADDYMHISMFLENPLKVSLLSLYIDVDTNTTNLTNAFTRNYWKWTFTQEQLNAMGPGYASNNSWVEILVPISSGIRYGGDRTRTFNTITAMRVELTSTAACNYGFDCWYFLGTYGPTVLPNSPVGIYYESRYRDSETGAASLPGPPTRYGVFPLREQVIVVPETTDNTDVDSIDIYRQGGGLLEMVYLATILNDDMTPVTYYDDQVDSSLTANPSPDLTLIQPWPVQEVPRSGTVNVVGTRVIWASGDKFDLSLIANTVILIGETAYQLYGNPVTDEILDINDSAGVQTGVPYLISSPILAGSLMPYVFGPLEGPFTPVVFGLGDEKNAGLLYYTNPFSVDAASDANTLEVTPPSEPLISGDTWQGLVIVGTKDRVLLIRYSYLQTQQNVTNNTTFQSSDIPTTSGMWGRFTCAAGPDGVYYLGHDGIYCADQTKCVNVTDEMLYPLFPHSGQAATGMYGLAPVNMAAKTYQRLSWCGQDMFFDYVDTNGLERTLRYEWAKKRWFPHRYAAGMRFHYLVEGSQNDPLNPEILMLPISLGSIVRVSGDTDQDGEISSEVITPVMTGGDDRIQKIYTDMTTDGDGDGDVTYQLLWDTQTETGPSFQVTMETERQQIVQNLASLSDLSSHRNISVRMTWFGGPSGPKLYELLIYAYAQPYLSKKVVTQFTNHGLNGWLHHRRMFSAVIANSNLSFTIKCEDGRVFGPYLVASTDGQLKIVPQILDQNIKDLAFAYELDGGDELFALFPDSYTIEIKEWTQEKYAKVPVFKT